MDQTRTHQIMSDTRANQNDYDNAPINYNIENEQYEENRTQQHGPYEEKRKLYLPYQQFQQQYEQSIRKLNDQTVHKIQTWAYNREKQNYFYFVQPEKFVQFSKNERMERFMEKNSELVTEMLLEVMGSREYKIEIDILEGVLEIGDKPRQVKLKDMLKQEQPNNNIKQLSQQQLKQQQQEIRRKYRQVVENQKKQKARLQRLRQLQFKQKKQLQQKLKAQQSLEKQQMRKHHSELISQKISDSLKKRQQQKKQRSQRQKDYNYIVKSWANGQILHQKMQRQFRRRYQQIIEQDRQRVQSQRSKLMMNAKVEDLNIKQHEQKYLKWRQENSIVRASKMEEHERMIQAFERELRRLGNGKSKHKDNCDDQEEDEERASSRRKFTGDNDYHKIRERQRLIAMEKRKKMQNYWSSFVKQDFQPTIDQRKRQQLQQIINSLQSAHKMKKVKDEKGQYRYEELKLVDPTLKGIQYLEYSRQIGRNKKQRSKGKRKQSTDDKQSIHSMHSQNQQQKRKSVDYLKQLRQSRSNSLNSSHSKLNKLSFLQKPDLTFHEKLSRVQRETFKLQQATKLSENQLKYGKFKTSEEILQYKEEIDNNHVEILKMKLKLVQKANGGQ